MNEQPATTTIDIRRILVPTDFSEGAAQALLWALDIARRTGAEVLLLHALGPLESDVWSPIHYSPEERVQRESTGKIISDLMEAALAEQNTEGVRVEMDTRRGNAVAPAVVAAAKEQRADLVVMGTHGRRGIRRVLLGSIAEEVVRTAPCPVLLIREDAARPDAVDVRQVLVPVDFSAYSRQVLPWGQALAAMFDARLVLLHVLEEVPMEGLYGEYYTAVRGVSPDVVAWANEEMQALVAEMTALGTAVTSHVETGHPPTVITDFAKVQDIDVIAMASHGRVGLPRFVLGSVAEKVTRAAPCPVLVVRGSAGEPSEDARTQSAVTVAGSVP